MFKIIVKKFGGAALKNIKNIKNICKIIKKYVLSNKKIIVVVSAPKNFTDLLNKISIKNIKNFREKSVLLSCGEQISSSIMSGLLKNIGIKSISLQGWQIPIFCKNKDIIYIYKNKIKKILKKYDVIVISGFQGINKYGNIVTLKRGGSDTSAVFISTMLNAKCYFYKDTSGIYQTDPKILKSKKLKKVFIEDLLEISSSGAKILSLNSVINIFKNNIKVKVLSFKNMKGTKIINKNIKNNFLVIKKEKLYRIKNKKYKTPKKYKIKEIIKISKKNIYFTSEKKIKDILKIEVYKISIIGLNVKRKIIKIFFNIKKYFYKKIINSLENKLSFFIKKKNKNKIIKKIKLLYKV